MEEAAQVANLFSAIAGTDVRCFTSKYGSHYAACIRRGEEWMFSTQRKGNCSHYILTVNNQYVLTGYALTNITTELEKLAANDQYIIQKNEGARQLSALLPY